MLIWKELINLSERGNLKPHRRVEKTEEEWRAQLTSEQ
ncbi:MAG: peptide-methionine (R)-S-oxide reductase, partial [Ulvibacter sp.]